MQLLQATKRRPLLDDERIWNDKGRISMSMVDASVVASKVELKRDHMSPGQLFWSREIRHKMC